MTRWTATTRWLLPALLCAAAGCADNAAQDQIVTGRLDTTSDAIAVRAVSGSAVVAAAQVATDGSFVLRLPAGASYRLEVLGLGGAANATAVVAQHGSTLTGVAFDVCHPAAAADLGALTVVSSTADGTATPPNATGANTAVGASAPITCIDGVAPDATGVCPTPAICASTAVPANTRCIAPRPRPCPSAVESNADACANPCDAADAAACGCVGATADARCWPDPGPAVCAPDHTCGVQPTAVAVVDPPTSFGCKD